MEGDHLSLSGLPYPHAGSGSGAVGVGNIIGAFQPNIAYPRAGSGAVWIGSITGAIQRPYGFQIRGTILKKPQRSSRSIESQTTFNPTRRNGGEKSQTTTRNGLPKSSKEMGKKSAANKGKAVAEPAKK
ncbi:hypothetical protein PIB30_099934, partial [Stylosanthes scabra]|nr:hypothetical protein [Stylosanthes scabra]